VEEQNSEEIGSAFDGTTEKKGGEIQVEANATNGTK
jgi:hypothetical protein